MKRRIVTDRIAQILVLAFAQLQSMNAVGREFGFCPKKLRSEFNKRGLATKPAKPRSKYSDEEVKQWHTDYVRLKSLQKTGALHGVHFMTVYQTLIKRGLIKPQSNKLPDDVVEAIAADYRRLKSLAQVADRCGRTRQSVWDILHRRGLTLPRKPGGKKVVHNGENFTVGKNGYLRSTRAATRVKGGSRLLHHVIWEEAHGPIPAGHVIWFTDRDRENCELSNLELLTRTEARNRSGGKNAWTVFYEVHDFLLGEYKAAMASGDPALIEVARKNYEGLERPNTWTAERKRKHTKWLNNMWAALTPAERRQRALHAARCRRDKAHQASGTAVERMAA